MKDGTLFQIPRIVLLITFVGLLLRLYYFDTAPVEIYGDPYAFSMISEGMLQGKLALEGIWGSRLWPTIQPLYPFLMALLSKVTGDFILSGKIISLLAGVATIPLVYLLWNTLDSKEVAVLASGLVAVNYAHWFYSVHALRDVLFLFFVLLSFLLFYQLPIHPKRLSWLALSLVLATFTREEGYLLAISLAFAYVYWKRKKILKKQYKVVPSVILYLAPILIWNLYKYAKTGSILPSFVRLEIRYHEAHGGIHAISQAISSISLPIFLIALAGIYLTHRQGKRELTLKYLPILSFILFDFLAMAWFEAPNILVLFPLMGLNEDFLFFHDVRRAIASASLLIGFFSIALISFSKWITRSNRLKACILCGALASYFALSFAIVHRAESQPEPYWATKEAMEWFNSHSAPGDKILAGEDRNVYGYYTDRQVIGGGGDDHPLWSSLGHQGDSHLPHPHLLDQ